MLLPVNDLVVPVERNCDNAGLMADIIRNGLTNPVSVYRDKDEWVVRDGGRRITVYTWLGWKMIPCQINQPT